MTELLSEKLENIIEKVMSSGVSSVGLHEMKEAKTMAIQLETKIASYREAYEQAVEAASQGWNVELPDLDGMLAWIEENKR